MICSLSAEIVLSAETARRLQSQILKKILILNKIPMCAPSSGSVRSLDSARATTFVHIRRSGRTDPRRDPQTGPPDGTPDGTPDGIHRNSGRAQSQILKTAHPNSCSLTRAQSHTRPPDGRKVTLDRPYSLRSLQEIPASPNSCSLRRAQSQILKIAPPNSRSLTRARRRARRPFGTAAKPDSKNRPP